MKSLICQDPELNLMLLSTDGEWQNSLKRILCPKQRCKCQELPLQFQHSLLALLKGLVYAVLLTDF